MVGQVDPFEGDEVLRLVPSQDAARLLALYGQAVAAEALVRRALAEFGLLDDVATLATVDAADRPVVRLTMTAAGARRLIRLVRGGAGPGRSCWHPAA